MRVKILGLVAVFALVVASCGGGSVEEAAGVSSGIGVHGAWTIDVVNSDGSVDQHLEFENDLTAFGAQNLVRLLASDAATGNWSVLLTGTFGQSVCDDDVGDPHFCEVREPGGANPASPYIQDTLQVGASATGDVLVLSGSVLAAHTGNVGSVATALGACSPATAPESCTESNAYLIPRIVTQTNVGPFDVVAGQIVQVQVDISFGTLP